MAKSLAEYLKHLEESERKGVSGRPPVATCVDCGRELYESPISADDTPDADLDPTRIGAP